MTAHKTRMLICPVCNMKTKFDVFNDPPYRIITRDGYEQDVTRGCVRCPDCYTIFDKHTMKRKTVMMHGHANTLIPIIENIEKRKRWGK